MQKKSFLLVFILSFVLFTLSGFINSYMSMSDIAFIWYNSLYKSPLHPDSSVFGTMWTILYFLNALAFAFLIVNKRFTAERFYEKSVKFFALQFVAQFFWSYIFWCMFSPLLGMINLIVVDILVYIMLRNVFYISRISFLLFIPYFLWLLFASYLNMFILVFN